MVFGELMSTDGVGALLAMLDEASSMLSMSLRLFLRFFRYTFPRV
jgi:hypothetical protein